MTLIRAFFQAAASRTSVTGMPMPRATARFVAASPPTSATEASSRTSGRAPSLKRWRATTNPSPPLFPLPATTTIRSAAGSEKRPLKARTMRSPAFSMSTTPGMPSSSIAVLSTAFISREVRIFMDVLRSRGDFNTIPGSPRMPTLPAARAQRMGSPAVPTSIC